MFLSKARGGPAPVLCPSPGSQTQAMAVSLGSPPGWVRRAPARALCHSPILLGAGELSQARGGQARSQLINFPLAFTVVFDLIKESSRPLTKFLISQNYLWSVPLTITLSTLFSYLFIQTYIFTRG